MRCPRLNAVINAVESIAPLKLADSSWDNVGLIYETPGHVAADTLMGVMLAIDLTEAIVKQARANNCQLIISYHPPWFRGVKRLTQDVGSEARLVGLAAAAGISLYSPHTATDNAKPGINDCVLDWLGTILATVKPIVPSAFDDGSGAGRIGCFPTPIPLREALKKVSKTFSLPTSTSSSPSFLDTNFKQCDMQFLMASIWIPNWFKESGCV